jgi:hypothetical protein
MRRREKFVISTALLTMLFFALQHVSLDWRYWGIAGLTLMAYVVSSWALSDDLQFYERLTIIPLPTLYTASSALFYFLLPGNIVSRSLILGLYGLGMYALYLTCNIFSVAKGRTIQLLYAAHAVGFLLTLLTSLLFTNTIFSLGLPFWGNGLLVGLVHFPLIFTSLWSVNLEDFIAKDLLTYAVVISLFLMEFVMLISFIPVTVWSASLFVTGLLYLILGILHSFLRGRLFRNTITEYSLMGVLLAVLFLVFFPFK